MRNVLAFGLSCLISVFSLSAYSQEESGLATQVEFGAIFTSGNTENENIKYKIVLDWVQQNWDYKFTSDGFRSSQDGISNAQRLYHSASANYTINEVSYAQGRVAYENDKFSGFDNQSDVTFSYGRNVLQNRDNMSLALTAGVGARRSVIEGDADTEGLVRFSANYLWNLSESADFIQDFSVDAGSNSSIYRTETGIQTDILENLSLKFTVKVKHQTDVPINREKTDTETAITLVLNF
jgi:putative salt-induced outer membrane protein